MAEAFNVYRLSLKQGYQNCLWACMTLTFLNTSKHHGDFLLNFFPARFDATMLQRRFQPSIQFQYI